MSPNTELAQAEVLFFEGLRPRLNGLAYRILGSFSDAEDAVQDTFLKWASTDRSRIENTQGWLISACTRRCLDMRRTGDRARMDYVGAWLPEPIQVAVPPEAETRVELASSLSMAFTMMLERLTPKERAAYLLHDIFDLTYGEVAETLDISESGGRKLVSRARASVSQTKTRHATPEPRQEEFLTAFQSAVETGELGALAQMLAQDARLSTDGGGKVAAIRDPILGRDAICDFVSRKLRRYWAELDWTRADLNGSRGVLIQADGQTSSAVSATFDEAGFVQEILIMRNPEKLRNLNPVQLH